MKKGRIKIAHESDKVNGEAYVTQRSFDLVWKDLGWSEVNEDTPKKKKPAAKTES